MQYTRDILACISCDAILKFDRFLYHRNDNHRPDKYKNKYYVPINVQYERR